MKKSRNNKFCLRQVKEKGWAKDQSYTVQYMLSYTKETAKKHEMIHSHICNSVTHMIEAKKLHEMVSDSSVM
jgi:hypothetical protein